ncbi:hypothetical protein KVV02_007401 [Mortierella alpina]|uniref:C2H2-type domain-containing protein n=1 Tax=Mortierella alpina TaxID=64518 RepID=A0A9P8CY59_MORAP|nr:hypothetical protein KVV02_007401 [Mortierella alpina]
MTSATVVDECCNLTHDVSDFCCSTVEPSSCCGPQLDTLDCCDGSHGQPSINGFTLQQVECCIIESAAKDGMDSTCCQPGNEIPPPLAATCCTEHPEVMDDCCLTCCPDTLSQSPSSASGSVSSTTPTPNALLQSSHYFSVQPLPCPPITQPWSAIDACNHTDHAHSAFHFLDTSSSGGTNFHSHNHNHNHNHSSHNHSQSHGHNHGHFHDTSSSASAIASLSASPMASSPASMSAEAMNDAQIDHMIRCLWTGCTAEFMSQDDLLPHVSRLHVPLPQNDHALCLWESCATEQLDSSKLLQHLRSDHHIVPTSPETELLRPETRTKPMAAAGTPSNKRSASSNSAQVADGSAEEQQQTDPETDEPWSSPAGSSSISWHQEGGHKPVKCGPHRFESFIRHALYFFLIVSPPNANTFTMSHAASGSSSRPQAQGLRQTGTSEQLSDETVTSIINVAPQGALFPVLPFGLNFTRLIDEQREHDAYHEYFDDCEQVQEVAERCDVWDDLQDANKFFDDPTLRGLLQEWYEGRLEECKDPIDKALRPTWSSIYGQVDEVTEYGDRSNLHLKEHPRPPGLGDENVQRLLGASVRGRRRVLSNSDRFAVRIGAEKRRRLFLEEPKRRQMQVSEKRAEEDERVGTTPLEDRFHTQSMAVEDSSLQSLAERNRFEVPVELRPPMNYIGPGTPRFSVPYLPILGPEIIVSVALYSSLNPTKRTQEFLFLGSQPLTALRDAFHCISDFVNQGAEEQQDSPIKNKSDKKVSNSFIFIEGVFYTDTPLSRAKIDKRNELRDKERKQLQQHELGSSKEKSKGKGVARRAEAAEELDDADFREQRNQTGYQDVPLEQIKLKDEHVYAAASQDYGQVIIDWVASNPQRQLDPDFANLRKKHMHDTLIQDVSIRINHPYLLVHQGNCEHLLMFRDLRLFSHRYDDQNRLSYPMAIFKSKQTRHRCRMCNTNPAFYITIDDRLAGETPSYFCEECYDVFHYDEDGNILYDDFKVFLYAHDEAK